MRIKSLYLGLIVLFGVGGLVSADPGRDADPLRTGYVIITPNARSASPVASIIFGHVQGNTTTEAGVLASNLTNTANVFVSVSGQFQKNIGIAVANPNNRS